MTLEAILAIVIFTGLVIGISTLIVQQKRGMVAVRQLDRSKLLADMIFEQYASYTNAPSLHLYDNVHPIEPKDFFDTADNFSFDHYQLTTEANCPAQTLLCTVNVVIFGPAGGSRNFSRSYNVRTGNTEGATVDVWVVRTPCDMNHPELCDGMSGFEVSADSCAISNYVNGRGTGDVIGYTARDGHAVLRNVAPISGLTIRARKPGSAVFAPLSAFTTGYFVGASGGSRSSDSQVISVVKTSTNIVVFSDFFPLGTVKGTLTNGTGPINNMLVVLDGTASTGWGVKYNNRWSALTDAQGKYAFYNVAPGPATVWAAGDPGSHYQVTPADTELFRYGYSNHLPYLITVPAPVDQNTSVSVTRDVSVTRMGWLRLKALTAGGVDATAFVNTRLPATLFHRANPVAIVVPTGGISLFNIFDVDNTTMTFNENLADYIDGYFGNLEAHAQTNVENRITITMELPYTVKMTIVDSGGNPMLNYMMWYGPTDDTYGYYTIPNYHPPLTATSTVFTDLFIMGSGHNLCPTPTTIHGRVVDATTGEPIGGIAVKSPSPAPVTGTTAADGSFTLPNAGWGAGYLQVVNLSCNSATRLCDAIGTVTIDPTLCQKKIVIGDLNGAWVGSLGLYYPNAGYSSSDNPTLFYPMVQYVVTGVLTDALSGQTVAGVRVCNRSQSFANPASAATTPSESGTANDFALNCGVSGSNGSYSVSAVATDRFKDATGVHHGSVQVYVPDNQTAKNGITYAGKLSTPYAIPQPAPGNGIISGIDLSVRAMPGSI